MASVTFFTATNMASRQVWLGSATGATGSDITITDSYNTGIYHGQFSYDMSGNVHVITQACDGRVQAPTVLRMAPKGLLPVRRAVSTTVRMAASPSAAHMAR
jgi:hypothetical protein